LRCEIGVGDASHKAYTGADLNPLAFHGAEYFTLATRGNNGDNAVGPSILAINKSKENPK
jgi:hypothetical protein